MKKMARLVAYAFLVALVHSKCPHGSMKDCVVEGCQQVATIKKDLFRSCFENCEELCEEKRRRLQEDDPVASTQAQCLTGQVVDLSERMEEVEARLGALEDGGASTAVQEQIDYMTDDITDLQSYHNVELSWIPLFNFGPYSDAVSKCQFIGGRICTAREICPHRVGFNGYGTPRHGRRNGDYWTPVSGLEQPDDLEESKRWIQTGTWPGNGMAGNVCGMYADHHEGRVPGNCAGTCNPGWLACCVVPEPTVLTWVQLNYGPWSAGVDKCVETGARLCTAREVCPHRGSAANFYGEPHGGRKSGDFWVAISGEEAPNDMPEAQRWIQAGTWPGTSMAGNTCGLYHVHHSDRVPGQCAGKCDPGWIACCK